MFNTEMKLALGPLNARRLQDFAPDTCISLLQFKPPAPFAVKPLVVITLRGVLAASGQPKVPNYEDFYYEQVTQSAGLHCVDTLGIEGRHAGKVAGST